MQPYGRIKRIKGRGNWKQDCHPNRNWYNWWEDFNTIVPRTTLKSMWRKQIAKNELE